MKLLSMNLYEDELMELIKLEGVDWKIYLEEPNADQKRRKGSCLRLIVSMTRAIQL